MDVLQVIYEKMMQNDLIKEQAAGRIKYYQYPETGDVDKPFIILEPLDDGRPVDFADNTWTKLEFLIQIEVWTPDRQTTLNLGNEIRDLMWSEFGFHQVKGPNEYNKKIYRKADRYKGALYRSAFNNL